MAKGGGYACFGIGRINRGWRAGSEARDNVRQAPSAYLRKFHYDYACLAHSEPALRMFIDAVGVERVVLGTDSPFGVGIDWQVSWVLSLDSLTQEENEPMSGGIWNNYWESDAGNNPRSGQELKRRRPLQIHFSAL